MSTSPGYTQATVNAINPFLGAAVQSGVLSKHEAQAITRKLRSGLSRAGNRPPGKRPDGQLVTARQAAAKLGCCVKTVLRMADDGILSRHYLRRNSNKSLRFRSTELDRLTQGE